MITEYLRKGGLAAIVLAVFALGAATMWTAQGTTARALDDHGVETIAYVVQKQPSSEEGRADRVTYLYRSGPVGGAQMTHRVAHEVPEAVFDRAIVGAQVEIRYLPESPAIAEVYPGAFSDGRTFMDVMALVAALAAAGIAVGGVGEVGLVRRPGMAAQAA